MLNNLLTQLALINITKFLQYKAMATVIVSAVVSALQFINQAKVSDRYKWHMAGAERARQRQAQSRLMIATFTFIYTSSIA